MLPSEAVNRDVINHSQSPRTGRHGNPFADHYAKIGSLAGILSGVAAEQLRYIASISVELIVKVDSFRRGTR